MRTKKTGLLCICESALSAYGKARGNSTCDCKNLDFGIFGAEKPGYYWVSGECNWIMVWKSFSYALGKLWNRK